MAGFSRSKYKPTGIPLPSVARDTDDEHRYMFSTQFQPCDARRAFPCFDEPALKASFELSIEIPTDLTALNNMPEQDTTASSRPGHSDWQWKVVRFEKSPVMSTYLFTWAFGDFGYIEAETERIYNGRPLAIRIYTTRGLEEQGRYALSHATKIIDLLSETFQTDYPLTKLDLLAVHDFPTGAMEGWGLATFATTMLLFDEKKSDQRFRSRIVNTVGHELAHQWFGNLVTIEWWNELWLNEGFATWVGVYVTDRLHPEWDMWGQFVAESMSEALNMDSIRKSHPIEVPVRSATDVAQIFDAISYLKGSAVVRMLGAHLSDRAFLEGVANYLKKHAYGNATTDDLWRALSESSGQDVKTLMSPWITCTGLPVVTVTEQESGQLTLRQSRFLLSGDIKPEEDQTIWTIPLALEIDNQKVSNTSIMTTEETTIDIDNAHTSFYKLNKNNIGFYRTNYPPSRLSKLASPQSMSRLSTEDKISLVSDTAALAAAGYNSTTALLSLLEGFTNEGNYYVWGAVIKALNNIRSVFADSVRISAALTAFTLRLITPAAERLGWTSSNPEKGDLLSSQLRAFLLEAAGLAGHAPTIGTALSLFLKCTTQNDTSAIDPTLRSAVFRIAIRHQGLPAYAAAQQVYLTSPTFDGAAMALAAMGHVATPELAREHLRFAFDGKGRVKVQDVHHVVRSLAANPEVSAEVWGYIRGNYEEIYQQLPMPVFGAVLRIGLGGYSSMAIHDEIKGFFERKDCSRFERGLGIVLDQIKDASQYRERDVRGVEGWLEAKGYL